MTPGRQLLSSLMFVMWSLSLSGCAHDGDLDEQGVSDVEAEVGEAPPELDRTSQALVGGMVATEKYSGLMRVWWVLPTGDKVMCSGVLTANMRVITASHCISRHPAPTTATFFVTMGDGADRQTARLSSFRFDDERDVAELLLATPIFMPSTFGLVLPFGYRRATRIPTSSTDPSPRRLLPSDLVLCAGIGAGGNTAGPLTADWFSPANWTTGGFFDIYSGLVAAGWPTNGDSGGPCLLCVQNVKTANLPLAGVMTSEIVVGPHGAHVAPVMF